MADLAWLLRESTTGQWEAFSSARDLVQSAMKRCRREGIRWPVRND